MFSKKHYEVIADIIKHSYTKENLINELVRYFKHDNERFNEAKFREVCGGKC